MDDRPITLTIGTAGHVDHGKTTLVRRMTGTDTDRLEEEHRRGISIVAGYAELELPSGRRASLVDVPGHERFVKNMVAGATGVDAFLLVVAADDGVMPQTREHLDVLRVLGVERGVVALTKVDMVDEEMVELAELDAAELLESVGLEAPILPVSGVTGEGLKELLVALDELAGRSEDGQAGTLARLPVDRAFVLKGIGLVATGTLWSGEVRPGDTLYTAAGRRPRVRGVQNHGRTAGVARAGARTALDLVGIEAADLAPGEVLLSSRVSPTRVLDARVQLLADASPLRHGTRLRLYHGTRATNARMRLLDRKELSPGESVLARLMLQEGLVALPGDRFVLRSSSPQITVGGGTILDPAPTSRRIDPGWLKALEGGDWARVVPLALARAPKGGMSAGEISLVVPAGPSEISAAVEENPEVAKVGDLYAPAAELETARKRLLETLKKRAKERPESPELSVAEARTATALDARLADALLKEMAGGEIRIGDAGVSLPDADEVPPELEEEAEVLLKELRRAGVEPPLAETTPAARLLLKRGEAVQLADGLFTSDEVAQNILEEIKTATRENGEISLADFRDRMGTSRKYAQAWLEYADTAGVTRRVGDARVLTRRYR
ncbi:MAG TPA: selenocysteine-specific translation elongation factor [Rubrobacteraceae bacterium]|nr:selenocysteine-specific translation elongation factor [Rubrobacteraceae bacterium]